MVRAVEQGSIYGFDRHRYLHLVLSSVTQRSAIAQISSVVMRYIDHRFTYISIRTTVRLWVPKTSSTSCDQAIFVDQATDASLSSDAVLLEIDRFG